MIEVDRWALARCIAALALLVGAALPLSAVTAGFVDDFAAPGVNGWTGGTAVSNPGAGGADGDGYLLLSSSFAGNFGSFSANARYQGDWTAAGIKSLSVFLNDVNAANAFEVHCVIADATTIWQYNVGFHPPNGAWQRYVVDLADVASWTRLGAGTSTFSAVLHSVQKVHFRHDVPPFVQTPNAISGDLGIDNVALETLQASTVAAVKQATAGSVLTVSGKKVSAAFPGYLYASDPDRTSGIRVVWANAVAEGSLVTVTGVLGVTDSEVELAASYVRAKADPGMIAPLSITNRALGGGGFGLQDAVLGGFGLNNIGLLVRAWGTVSETGAGYLYIDDGSLLNDGIAAGIRVVCDPTGYNVGDNLIVTGISSCFPDGLGGCIRKILTRGPGDVRKANLP